MPHSTNQSGTSEGIVCCLDCLDENESGCERPECMCHASQWARAAQVKADATRSDVGAFDIPDTRAGTLLFDLLAIARIPDEDRRQMQSLIPKIEEEAAR